MSDFDDEYAESLERELRELHGALLDDQVRLLAPAEPIALPADTSVQEAIARMVAQHRSGVVIVDGAGRLTGVFTERDVLIRVLGQGRDPASTRLAEVMTPDPEALGADDRIGYAINRMSVAGYRTIPLVDAQRRPIGIVTVNDVIRWLAEIFPESVLNVPPGDKLKDPSRVDSG